MTFSLVSLSLSPESLSWTTCVAAPHILAFGGLDSAGHSLNSVLYDADLDLWSLVPSSASLIPTSYHRFLSCLIPDLLSNVGLEFSACQTTICEVANRSNHASCSESDPNDPLLIVSGAAGNDDDCRSRGTRIMCWHPPARSRDLPPSPHCPGYDLLPPAGGLSSWSQSKHHLPGLPCHATVIHDGKLFVLAGYDPFSHCPTLHSIDLPDLLDSETQPCSSSSSSSTTIASHSSQSVHDPSHPSSWLSLPSLTSRASSYDFSACIGWTPSGAARLYVLGGSQGPGYGTVFADSAAFDLGSQQWLPMEPMRTARCLHAALPISIDSGALPAGDGSSLSPSQRILVCGGSTTTRHDDPSCEIYDPVCDSWIRAAPMKQGRFHHAGCLFQGDCVVLGGMMQPSRIMYMYMLFQPHTAEAYDIRANQWRALHNMMLPRTNGCAFVLPPAVNSIPDRSMFPQRHGSLC